MRIKKHLFILLQNLPHPNTLKYWQCRYLALTNETNMEEHLCTVLPGKVTGKLVKHFLNWEQKLTVKTTTPEQL